MDVRRRGLADYPGFKTGPISSTLGGQRREICDLNYDGTAIAKLSSAAAWSPFDNFSIGLQTILYSGRFANTVTLSNCDGVICTQPENPDYDSAIQVTSDPLFAGTGARTSVRMELGADRFGLRDWLHGGHSDDCSNALTRSGTL